MSEKTLEIQQAIHSIMNDVVERSFQQLISMPAHRQELNEIIDEASNEIQFLNGEVKTIGDTAEGDAQNEAYRQLLKKLNKKSLVLLSRIQNLQRANVA